MSQCRAYSYETDIRRLSGCRVTRITDRAHARVDEHSHDWPVLSLYVLGGYTNRTTVGESRVSSPSATLYRAGEAHANTIGENGYEQIQLEFDPDWLDLPALHSFDPVLSWIGGPVAASARALAALWQQPGAREAELAEATRTFLRLASSAGRPPKPPWLDHAVQRLTSDAPPSTIDLARELGMNPGWLAEAYRRAMGEGVAETVVRRRVEVSARLLRETEEPAAEVASAAGFCDQSHMIRAYRKWLGRTPSQVRSEAAELHGSS